MQLQMRMRKKLLKGVKGIMIQRSGVQCYSLVSMVKNLTPRGGPAKLRDFWEDIVYTVVRQMGYGC